MPALPIHPDKLPSPRSPGRWEARLSLLMVAGTVAATAAAWILGTFLVNVVFGLDEQQLLTEAGLRGYVASLFLVALMALPAVLGIVLGVRARHHGERRLGAIGIVVNAAIATYIITTTFANLFG